MPFALVGISAILVSRLGWPGIIILLMIVLLTPLQIYVGKWNGLLLQKVNINKDKRIKATTEII